MKRHAHCERLHGYGKLQAPPTFPAMEGFPGNQETPLATRLPSISDSGAFAISTGRDEQVEDDSLDERLPFDRRWELSDSLG